MRIIKNLDLTPFNSYKIKSKCVRAFFPENEQDFIDIYRNYKNKYPKIILGGGFNVILSKENNKEDFIIVGDQFANISFEEPNLIVAQAGLSTKKMSEFALDKGLSGVEIFYDIPSSVGGAVVMNAGASGEEIRDILTKVIYLDLVDLKIKEIYNEEMGFQYRNSFFQKNPDKIVLQAIIKLKKMNPRDIKDKMIKIKESRWSKQPREYPNAGSVFKRPKGYYVGVLIDELNLKGFTIGGAKISEKHGGFIVNFNNATGSDILKIIEEVKYRVYKKYNINLEVEQRII